MTMTTTHSPFLRLPRELLDGIAVALLPTDLLSFRATCKDIFAATKDAFIHVYFHEREYLLTDKHSMQCLLQVSEHAIFSKAVRRIRLVSTRLSSEILEGPGSKQLMQDEKAFRSKCLKTLTTALLNFKAHNNIPSVVVGPHDFFTNPQYLPPLRPWGYRRLCRLAGGYDPLQWGYHDPAKYRIVFHAIVDADYPAAELGLGREHEPVSLSLLKYHPDAAAFRDVRQLRLDVLIKHEDFPVGIEPCLHFLANLSNLTKLSLNVKSRSPDTLALARQLFEQLTTWHRDGRQPKLGETSKVMMNLESLEVANYWASIDTIVEFVGESKQTLKQVNLELMHESECTRADAAECIRAAIGGTDLDLEVSSPESFRRLSWTSFDDTFAD